MNGQAPSLRVLLQEATALLQAAGSPSARVDAEYLLLHVLQKDRSWLRCHDEVRPSAAEQAQFAALLQRRRQGEPVAYVTGERGFWSLDLQVGPACLIPRPETELLVEFALEKIAGDASAAVLDLGTGSGAIALAVKKERPQARLTAVDASIAALAQAEANAQRLQLAVEFVHSDWFAALAGRHFHLVLANPPYIAADDAHLGQGDVRFEPLSALVAPEQGLRDLRQISAQAPAFLQAGGWLAMEHGFAQGEAVRTLLAQAGFVNVATRRDLGGQERMTLGQWP